jgi:tetratricopeptide (TPR) repeat protein
VTDQRQVAGQLERNLRFLAGVATRDGRLALLTVIGDEQRELGRLREAETTLREACALAEELVDRRARVDNLIVLARTVAALNRPTEAEALLREADLLCRERLVGERHDAVLAELGVVLDSLGRRDEAVPLLRQALTVRTAKGDRVGAAAIEKLLGSWGRSPTADDWHPAGWHPDAAGEPPAR